MSLQDLTGQIFSRLTVIGPYEIKNGTTWWTCRCECGEIRKVAASNLKKGHTRSCGCFKSERISECKKTHGEAYRGTTVEYTTWARMIQRCTNEKNPNFKNYGGRGIKVCDRWRHSYENFLADMGRRPGKGYSIERKEVNGNYNPDNCCWATAIEQASNQRTSHKLTYQGQTLTQAEWARRLGMKLSTLQMRLQYGWSVEKVLSTPVRKSSRGGDPCREA